MRKLAVFNNITLDGYFSAANGDIGWAHGGGPDPEFDAFVAENASGGGQLLLGRKTYDLMAGYWPTEMAKRNAPAVAEHMNRLPKVVFSRTLDRAAWSNTEVVKGDIAAAILAALWCWLRGADRGDLLHTSRKIVEAVASEFNLDAVIDGFNFGGGRDLTGYQDGTENPQGKKALEAAIVQGQGDGLDGSSFVAVQQWVHDFKVFDSDVEPGTRQCHRPA